MESLTFKTSTKYHNSLKCNDWTIGTSQIHDVYQFPFDFLKPRTTKETRRKRCVMVYDLRLHDVVNGQPFRIRLTSSSTIRRRLSDDTAKRRMSGHENYNRDSFMKTNVHCTVHGEVVLKQRLFKYIKKKVLIKWNKLKR